MRFFASFGAFVTSASLANGVQASELIERTHPNAAQPGELIERTVAIVAGQVITLSDVRTALALNLVRTQQAPRDEAAAITALINRLLMLREVQRYAPAEPAAAEIEQQFAAVRSRFAAPDAFARALEAGGFSEARLRAWIRDDLRLASYLSQRFAAVGVPTDDEVSSYYSVHRDEFERDRLTFAQAAPVIRQRLADERRAGLIADWIEDLRRRTPVVELWKG